MRRRGVPPYGADQPLPGDRMPALQQQHGQDHPLLYGSEIYRLLTLPDPERPQHPESRCRIRCVAHALLPPRRVYDHKVDRYAPYRYRWATRPVKYTAREYAA